MLTPAWIPEFFGVCEGELPDPLGVVEAFEPLAVVGVLPPLDAAGVPDIVKTVSKEVGPVNDETSVTESPTAHNLSTHEAPEPVYEHSSITPTGRRSGKLVGTTAEMVYPAEPSIRVSGKKRMRIILQPVR